MSKCIHQFFCTAERTRHDPKCPHFKVAKEMEAILANGPKCSSNIHGMTLLCGLCAELREVWENGDIIILHNGNITTKKAIKETIGK